MIITRSDTGYKKTPGVVSNPKHLSGTILFVTTIYTGLSQITSNYTQGGTKPTGLTYLIPGWVGLFPKTPILAPFCDRPCQKFIYVNKTSFAIYGFAKGQKIFICFLMLLFINLKNSYSIFEYTAGHVVTRSHLSRQ